MLVRPLLSYRNRRRQHPRSKTALTREAGGSTVDDRGGRCDEVLADVADFLLANYAGEAAQGFRFTRGGSFSRRNRISELLSKTEPKYSQNPSCGEIGLP